MKPRVLRFAEMRWITRGSLLPLLAAVAAGLLFSPPAGATETLDQSQPISQSPSTVSFSVQRGQIFAAGRYGTLNRVSLYIENYVASPPAGAVLTVSVQTVINGLPSGKQIGSGTIPLSAIPAPVHADWVSIDIHGALVAAGTQYALVLQTSPWNASVTYWHAYNTSYARGEMAVNYGDGWITEGMYDFRFQTYVIPDVLDQGQYSGGWGGIHQNTMGQTFTAGLSGVLDRVSVFVSPYDYGTIEATIQTLTKEGYPSGTVIGRGSVSGWEGNVPYWTTIGISGAAVTAGTRYALVLRSTTGVFYWLHSDPAQGGGWYTGGDMLFRNGSGWTTTEPEHGWGTIDADFETYIVTPLAFAPPPPPPVDNTPCSSSVCPSAGGLISPPDSPARVTSLVQFWSKPDGRIEGILHFDDSRTGDLALRGCSASSSACRLTVTRFACTDEHAINISGTYTPKGEDSGGYQLTLSGVKGEVGNFTLTISDYTYSLTHKGIVDVTCPPAAGATGKR